MTLSRSQASGALMPMGSVILAPLAAKALNECSRRSRRSCSSSLTSRPRKSIAPAANLAACKQAGSKENAWELLASLVLSRC